ncbi:MAG: hypothetical protein U0Z75_10510 [Deinococcaceae bacterium]
MQIFNRLKQRDIALASIFVTVLLLISWYFSMYQTVQADIVQKQTDLDAAQGRLRDAEAAERLLPELRKAVGDLKVQQDAFLRRLPKAVDLSTFFDELRLGVSGSRAELMSLSQNATAPTTGALPSGVQAISINLKVDGTFGAIYQTLRSIEQLQRFSTISGVTLRLGNEIFTFDPKISADINMNVYTFDPNVAAAAAQPPATATPAPSASAPGGSS